MVNFVRGYVANLNADGGRKSLGWLTPPPLLWTFGQEDAYRGGEPIVRVEIVEELWFFDGQRPQLARRSRPQLVIPIPFQER